MVNVKNIYDFRIEGIGGEIIDFSDFKDKNILIVNTASACGFTYQYEQLQALYEEFKDKLVVIGVPSNDFGNQETGSEEEINDFCKSNFHVEFPLARKTAVSGPNRHPLFEWLTGNPSNRLGDVKWNFHKFFIDRNGDLVSHFPSTTEPYSDVVLQLIN